MLTLRQIIPLCLPTERLFERALLRELTGIAAAVFFVLLSIILVTRGVRLLGLAASGNVASEAIAAMLGFVLLGAVPWLIPATVFITVLMALSRAWRDHEMAIWMAAGLNMRAWIKPVLTFAIPMLLLTAILSFGLSPWGSMKAREYKEILATRDDLSALSPGLFKESSRADRVYFIENFSGENGSARNIFVQALEGKTQTVTVASSGHLLNMPDGERVLVLKDGRRYEGVAGQADYRVVSFNEARIRVEEAARSEPTASSSDAMPSLALLGSSNPHDQAELARRLAMPLATLILALLAIPLAYVNPRVGRSINLIAAALLFSIYLNLINVFEAWIASGQLPPWLGLWPVHLGFAALTIALFHYRSRPRG